MKGAKEFVARSLDEAIEAACTYYDLSREKLEVEILNDAKSGIFGLVGAKKAKILAKQASVSNYTSLSARENEEPKAQKSMPKEESSFRQPHAPRQGRNRKPDFSKQPEKSPVPSEIEEDLDPTPGNTKSEATTSSNRPKHSARPDSAGRERSSHSGNSARSRGRSSEQRNLKSDENSKSPQKSGHNNRKPDGRTQGQPEYIQKPEAELPLEQNLHNNQEQIESTDCALDFEVQSSNLCKLNDIDKEKALSLVEESLQLLLKPICPEADINVVIEDGRIEATINDDDASGLIIGREGQTLAALQYMVSRIVSRKMEAPVHVHLDTGDYKERQDQKLKELSLCLAERARESGRTQYTRPLSSYHRRLVHMELQTETDIETRSKGDGAMKRVYIFVRRTN